MGLARLGGLKANPPFSEIKKALRPLKKRPAWPQYLPELIENTHEDHVCPVILSNMFLLIMNQTQVTHLILNNGNHGDGSGF